MEDIDIAEYKKSLSELYEILKHLPIEARNKIPDEELKLKIKQYLQERMLDLKKGLVNLD